MATRADLPAALQSELSTIINGQISKDRKRRNSSRRLPIPGQTDAGAVRLDVWLARSSLVHANIRSVPGSSSAGVREPQALKRDDVGTAGRS